MFVDWGSDDHDHHVGTTHLGRIGGSQKTPGCQYLGQNFRPLRLIEWHSTRIHAIDGLLVDVERAHVGAGSRERQRQWETHMATPTHNTNTADGHKSQV